MSNTKGKDTFIFAFLILMIFELRIFRSFTLCYWGTRRKYRGARRNSFLKKD